MQGKKHGFLFFSNRETLLGEGGTASPVTTEKSQRISGHPGWRWCSVARSALSVCPFTRDNKLTAEATLGWVGKVHPHFVFCLHGQGPPETPLVPEGLAKDPLEGTSSDLLRPG